MNLFYMGTCADGVRVAQSPDQVAGGGALPTSALQKYRVEECKFKDIRHIFEEFHYKKGHMGGGISLCLRLVLEGRTVGGAVIGKPRHGKKYSGSLEIRRMALLDECPKNSESWFLGKIVWWIKKHTDATSVLSYADASVGHRGTIYSASNFKMVGHTAPSIHVFWNNVRYHPRSLTIERPYSHLLRAAVEKGEAKIERGEPKSVWIYKINR